MEYKILRLNEREYGRGEIVGFRENIYEFDNLHLRCKINIDSRQQTTST